MQKEQKFQQKVHLNSHTQESGLYLRLQTKGIKEASDMKTEVKFTTGNTTHR